MSQARVLTERELRKVLNFCNTQPHATRNRTMLLCTHMAGMRVGEVAALTVSDVLATDGTVKEEIALSAQQTKGNKARTICFAEKARVELAAYEATHKVKSPTQPLFYSQHSDGFRANTLTHIVNGIYKNAGISGTKSHSVTLICVQALYVRLWS